MVPPVKVLRPVSTSVPVVPCLLMPKVPLITPPMVRVPEMSWVALAVMETLPVPKLRPLPPVRKLPAQTELLFGETDEFHPFVTVEQMMPFVPFVRCRDVDEAIAKAKHYEHGFRHTSIIHSNNVRNMTKMGRTMDTTLFVKNGPCMASLGLGGEGYLSFSIATPTGEGVTTPLTFTRVRRSCTIGSMRII